MQKTSASKIAIRAYSIWEQAGRPHGFDLDHWLRAERELEPKSKSKSVRTSKAATRQTSKQTR